MHTNPEKRGVVSEWWKTFKLTYGTHVRSAIPSKPCQKCTNRAKNVHLKLKRIIQLNFKKMQNAIALNIIVKAKCNGVSILIMPIYYNIYG